MIVVAVVHNTLFLVVAVGALLLFVGLIFFLSVVVQLSIGCIALVLL